MARESLHGVLEKPLHEAMKEKSGLQWNLQDVQDAKALGHLPRRAANGANQPMKKCVVVNKAGRSRRREEPFNKAFTTKHRETECGVYLPAFSLSWVLTMSLSLSFGMAMYALCHCVLDICNLLFDFTED